MRNLKDILLEGLFDSDITNKISEDLAHLEIFYTSNNDEYLNPNNDKFKELIEQCLNDTKFCNVAEGLPFIKGEHKMSIIFKYLNRRSDQFILEQIFDTSHTSIKISKIICNVPTWIDCQGLFSGCCCDTIIIKKIGSDEWEHMFRFCTAKSITFEKNCISDDYIYSCANLFNQCKNLEKIDLTNFTQLKYTANLNGLFGHCINLKEVIFPKGVNNNSSISRAFSYCKSLKAIDLSFIGGYDKHILIGNETFLNCDNLESVIFNKDLKYHDQSTVKNMFEGCDKLKSLTLTHDFLKLLQIRNANIPEMNNIKMKFYD
jgi:hypothetical protein